MSDADHKTRIEIIRNDITINTIIPKPDDSDVFEMSTSSSINSFPTLSIKSSTPEICTPFMGFSKSDIVRLSVSNTPRDEYMILFEGEFSKKTTKIEAEPKRLILEIGAIHSFFKLSMLELASSKELMGITFKEFVSSLVNMAGISSKVEIDRELSEIIITGLSHHTNAFRLFKEVCLIVNAAAIFNSDNTVNIDYRVKRLAKIRAQREHTITDKDIINMISEESI